MDETEAQSRINMELLESGNGHYDFGGIADDLRDALHGRRTTYSCWWTSEYEGCGTFIGIKPPSGVEVEFDIDLVRTALGEAES